MRARVLAIAAVLLAASLSACGGEDGAGAAQGSPSNPLPGKLQQSSGALGGPEKEGSAPGAKAEQPGYQSLVDRQDANPRSRFTPCNLVTRAQARAILGTPVLEPSEGAQGPTCIYRSEDGEAFVTLAVQSLEVEQVRRRLREPRTVAIGDRTALCGRYGQEMLYVPVDTGRVLTIGAPCDVAARFAARAVRQL